MTEFPQLSLHVPEPAVRPGGMPDFSNVDIAKAGSVPRPRSMRTRRDIRDLAYSIIRVLEPRRARPSAPGPAAVDKEIC
jgi:2-oxoisovalerate dehydrogenase E1 component alpha subunit